MNGPRAIIAAEYLTEKYNWSQNSGSARKWSVKHFERSGILDDAL